jgi:hypothetical protein
MCVRVRVKEYLLPNVFTLTYELIIINLLLSTPSKFFRFDNKIVGNVNKHDTGYQNQTITE